VTGVAVKAAPALYKANKLANGQQVTDAYAMKYFKDRGFSDAEAAGLASQIHSESNGRANAPGDFVHGKPTAFGLIQWHEDRQANFKKMYGHDIQHSTSDEQLGFIVHELKVGTERGAQKKLEGVTDPYQAASSLSKNYVRPKDVEGEAKKRGNYAAQIFGIQGAGNSARLAGQTGTPSTTTDNRVTNTVGSVTINAPSGDARGIAQAFQSLNIFPAVAAVGVR
jgi:hypothetical protein